MKHSTPTIAILVVFSNSGCGVGSTLTAEQQFMTNVAPILEARCGDSSCHGVPLDADEAGLVVDWSQFLFEVDASGRATDPSALYAAAIDKINSVEDPVFSSLLRKPLSVNDGGVAHYGAASFSGSRDESYQEIWRWIAAEPTGGEDPEPLNELEQIFADVVQPALVDGACMASGCHGLNAGAIKFNLDVGYLGEFSIEETRHNYETALEQLSLDGFISESRLIRKAQSFPDGIAHKGTNFDFFADIPGEGLAGIERWGCLEREARVGVPCADVDDPPITGFIYLSGVIEPLDPFNLEVYQPGAHIYRADVADASVTPESTELLTSGFQDGTVDIRDLSVSPDGQFALFSARTATSDGHQVYQLDLQSGEIVQVTDSLGSNRDPVFGPDGSIWFVSTRLGRPDDSGTRVDSDIYSVDITGELYSGMPVTSLPTEEARRWSFTPHVERKPQFFNIGPNGGELSVTALRDVVSTSARAHAFRFPLDLSAEYHQHFGITPEETLTFDTRELPDGRYLATVGDLSGVWSAGQLAVIDRNFGPQVGPFDTPAFSLYLEPIVFPDQASTTSGITPRAYRDPAALPDGRVLVATSKEPLNLDDDEEQPSFQIELLTFSEDYGGNGPEIVDRQTVISVEGLSVYDPEVIYHRRPVRSDGSAHLEDQSGFGTFHHHGLPLVDALLGGLSPSGERDISEDIVGVRIVTADPNTLREEVPPEETMYGVTGATSTGLSPHPPASTLAEILLEEDGSFSALIEAEIPFRLQALNDRGMLVGSPHNRWYDLQEGQTIVQGLSAEYGTERYGSLCGACHGNLDGEEADPPLAPPDLLTTASLTLARYDDQNPRLPRELLELSSESTSSVDFLYDVQPILDDRCGSCHDYEEQSGGLDLTSAPTQHFSVAYENLLRPGVRSNGGGDLVDSSVGMAANSYLLEYLLGEEFSAPAEAPLTAHLESQGSPALSDEEIRTIIEWIDLGATFTGGHQ